ncbi:hypothetical protein ACJJTC_003527 [Scirpophaga incertulas]
MTCHIDQVVPAYSDAGVILDDITEVQAHFIRDDVPVLSEEIDRLRSDTLLLYQIQTRLSEQALQLHDVMVGPAPDSGVDTARRALYALAALATALAILCLALLLTFILRTRKLNRQLQALSMTKYGSVDSGLNRAGLAPNTNKHAVEGSNPIWNEAIKAPDFDAVRGATSDMLMCENGGRGRESCFSQRRNNNSLLSEEDTENKRFCDEKVLEYYASHAKTEQNIKKSRTPVCILQVIKQINENKFRVFECTKNLPWEVHG